MYFSIRCSGLLVTLLDSENNREQGITTLFIPKTTFKCLVEIIINCYVIVMNHDIKDGILSFPTSIESERHINTERYIPYDHIHMWGV